jgi:hypothetical protein
MFARMLCFTTSNVWILIHQIPWTIFEAWYLGHRIQLRRRIVIILVHLPIPPLIFFMLDLLRDCSLLMHAFCFLIYFLFSQPMTAKEINE